MTIGQANRSVSKWDMKQWQAAVEELQDEDWLPEAKKRLTPLGVMAGMSLAMMVGSIAGLAILRLTNRRQKIVARQRRLEKVQELDQMAQSFENKPSPDDVQDAYDAVLDKAKDLWRDAAKKAQAANKPAPARVLPGNELSDRLWLDGDKLLNDVQTRMFYDMVNCRDIEDLSNVIKPHINKDGYNPKLNLGDRVKQDDYITERLLRTELARMRDSINTASYIANGIKWVNIINEPGACSKCVSLAAAGPYPINEAPLLPDESHPNCRCGKVPATGPDDEPYMAGEA